MLRSGRKKLPTRPEVQELPHLMSAAVDAADDATAAGWVPRSNEWTGLTASFDPVEGGIETPTQIFDPRLPRTGIVLGRLDKFHETHDVGF